MTTGSCLCGQVRWQFERSSGRMSHCHCSMCRKAHGAAFATILTVAENDFRWTAGQDTQVQYEATLGAELLRSFCPTCGSALPASAAAEYFVPAGCLDDDPAVRPSLHIFVGSKAPWHSITDRLPQHDAYDSDSNLPVVERPEAPPSSDGKCRGSCLCATVVFNVIEPFKVVHNCHCSRCRKARAAAHTTNGFVSVDGVEFVSGEDNLVDYKVPDAKFFTHVFCKTCGSGMPRRDPARGLTAVPLGALDEDPGAGAVDNIFVNDKAPWYEITDSLPTFEEGPT